MIEVLFEGEHKNFPHEGAYYHIDPLTSSVTLIQEDGVNILFDVSSMVRKDQLLEVLEERGLKPEDIHHVVNSHHHLDHTFNNHLFAGTAFIHSAHAMLDKEGVAHIFPPDEVRGLPKDVELVETPGHTEADVSLVYEWEGKTWMCVGDAVREDLIRAEAPLSTRNPQDLLNTMKLIFERADVIIPGHGRVIEGKLKDELYELLNQLTLPVDVD